MGGGVKMKGNGASQAEISNDGSKHEVVSVGDESLDIDETVVRAALFAAVEGGADGTERLLSCSPLVKLFFSPEANTLQDRVTMSAQDQKETLLGAIRSHKFHKGYARRFFAAMSGILKRIVDEEDYVPVSAYESDDEDEEENEGFSNENSKRKSSSSISDTKDIIPDAESTEALLFMKACAFCVSAYLDGLVDRRSENDPPGKTYSVVDEVFAVGEMLHDVLFSLQSYCGAEGLQVQGVVASLCEKWWQNNFVDKDYMVVQLIPFLVVKSLDGSAQKSDIKRLFTVKEAFKLLDFEEESIAYLLSLVLRTVSSPLYLRMTEGKRLIAYFFSLHESLVRDLHTAIRVQIPEAKKTILESYGDIYFRAWMESEPGSITRSSIEEFALQDLMYAVLHIAGPSMSKSLHIVLKPFHDAQKTQDVEKLLHRMYGPILWRSLKAANSAVRSNAAHILAEVFPLQDPSSDHVKLEQSVKKATTALESLLVDLDPKIRIAGAAATAKILTRFWDVLSTTDIRTLMNHIVTELASDSSSSAVRAAAVNSVTTLLDAPQSHAVLRPLLPALGNMIHDKVERVRLAVIRMLLRIKTIRGIKYYHVVPVDHLLARLAEEGRSPRNPQGPVTSALTSLMLNSYFPQGENVSGSDQINRTLSFLATHRQAAAVFYCNVALHLNVNSVSKLAAMLLRCLSAAVEADKTQARKNQGSKKRRRYGSRQSEEDNATGTNAQGTLTASNTAMMATVAETICTLWDSIENELDEPQNEPCNDFLRDAFSGVVLTEVHAHFEQKANEQDVSEERGALVRQECFRACAAILRCAGRLPPESVEGLSSHLTTRMKLAAFQSSGDSDSTLENLSPHVALLCLWGLTEDVARSLSSSIESAFGNENAMSFERVGNSNKRKASRGSGTDKESFDVVPRLPPNVALDTLENILCGHDPSSIAARTSLLQSTSACSAFERALELATVHAERILMADPVLGRVVEESDVCFVLKACEAYGRLIMHKQAVGDAPLRLDPQARTLLSWTTEKVVPIIFAAVDGRNHSLQDLNISRISSSADSPMPPGSPTPMEPPRRRANRNSTPIKFNTSFESLADHDRMSIGSEGNSNYLSLAATFSLIKSSCFIFSEWLAIGGEGVQEISFNASKWCRVLSLSSESFVLQNEVLPALCRLAVQLCRQGSNFQLLKDIVLNAKELEVDYDFGIVRRTVTSILSGNDGDGVKMMERSVDAILESVYEIVEGTPPDSNEEHHLPDTFDVLFSEEEGSIKASLSAISANQQASVVMGTKLLQSLGKRSKDDKSRAAFFEAKCIWMLCERLSGRAAKELRNEIQLLDADRYETDLGALVGEILDGVA